MNKDRHYRLELEGLRAVAALLVAMYHIWFNRVSGGVDVFFVVSGFLITTSLFFMYKREGTIHPFSYIVKLLKRLIPTAWTIGILTFVMSLVILPLYTRQQNLVEFVASLFYIQNWQLGFSANDYLAQNSEASPFQHFWALSIQFQFYLIWLLLFGIAVIIVRKTRLKDIRPSLTIMFGLLIFSSLTYSIYLTEVNQPFAYYHTFTRVWEFGVGGALALLIHKIKINQTLARSFSWVGLFGLISGGLLFQVSDVFPGYAALWPVLSAVLIIVSGQQAGPSSATGLLRTKPLVWFGGISYAFYLWHWPLLIGYYELTGTETVSVAHGFSIILVATALSYITIRFIETPIRIRSFNIAKTAATIGVLALTVLISAFLYQVTLQGTMARSVEDISKSFELDTHPGAMVTTYDGTLEPDVTLHEPFRPNLQNAYYDRSVLYEDKCILGGNETEPVVCDYGETEKDTHTIALVGGSHSAHWLPMLREALKDEPVKITTYLKGTCRFTTDRMEEYPECYDWFNSTKELLVENDPDLIFTVGDVGDHEEKYDRVQPGFIDAWKFFDEENIDLLLVRDTPWYKENVLDCIEENQGNAKEACRADRDEVTRTPSPLSQVEEKPDNVDTIDVNDYFCDDEECHYIVGNVVTHFDSHHITATFSRTLAPIMKPQVMESLGIN
ncbi:acyltransferase family protein [Salimicrobium halophilum]|uniref:Peptidoglycan/LPS O-acetylase OafA/YrhL, contains acyltransferase and SGNH-hydrolase domains n=1 Tax=Salimicrobium halophilum TaxID=86666 RepID=A0A1G8S7U5_9BACI|nr:acyltransferase family protein [Salimicrobium halophilum]SDJ25314.1 Peptidoglycan/LPS O-acetylase OafA/YrhL, contains acyltransferase and SGNH-hydrolase domains [Salimicrobium halophilum]